MSQPVRIRLTDAQVKQVQPFVDRVRSAAALGSPGMLVGQIGWNQEGEYFITPAFLPNDLARLIKDRGREDIPGDTRPVAQEAETA